MRIVNQFLKENEPPLVTTNSCNSLPEKNPGTLAPSKRLVNLHSSHMFDGSHSPMLIFENCCTERLVKKDYQQI